MTISISLQDDTELGGPGSILVRQRREHARLDELLHRVASTARRERAAALNELARLVFPHAFAEESVLWPLARRVLGEAHELTLEIEQEHQRITELWSELEPLAEDDPRADELINELSALLRRDARDEEDKLLPLLRDHLDDAALRQVGRTWELVRRVAPTRPHAVVARRPPGNVLAALPLTLLDRARDRADGVARRGGRPAARAERVSDGLARVAGRIEHLPGMRRGEDASTRANRSSG